MKYQKIFIVFVLSSLLLLLPLFEPAHQLTTLPDATNSIIIDVHTPKIRIDTQIVSTVIVSIYWLNSATNTSRIIATNLSLNGHLDIDTARSGLYMIKFNTTELGTITIRGNGLYFPSIIVLTIAIIIGLIILYDFLQKNMY